MTIESLRPKRLTLAEVSFQFTESEGRSRPLVGVCLDPSGDRFEYVLKLRVPQTGGVYPWEKCLARELIGSVIARAIGLRVPDYAVVSVTDDIIRAAAQAQSAFAPLLGANRGHIFGCAFVEDGRKLLPSDASDFQDWCDLLGFDSTVWNADRKGGNPNLLTDGRHLTLIDHGMIIPTWTFGADNTDPSTPWDRLSVRSHVSFPRLVGTIPDRRILSQWDALDIEALLAMLDAEIPHGWSDSSDRSSWRSYLRQRGSALAANADAVASHLIEP